MPTKKLVPRDNNEGGLGTALKTWGASWLQNLVITNLQTSTSASVLVETAGDIEKRAATSFLPNLESLDEGVSLTTTTESINYVGAGVTTTVSGNDTTVTITGSPNTVLDTEHTDCFVGMYEAAAGALDPKTDEQLRFNALIGKLYVGGSLPTTSLHLANQSIYSDNDLVIEAGNVSSVSISSGSETFFYNTGSQTGQLDINGLWINPIPLEAAPTHIIVDNVANPGLFSKIAVTDFTATTLAVLDTENAGCFVGLYEAATGNLAPKTDEGLTYNATTGSEVLSIAGDILMGDGTNHDDAIIDVKVSNVGINGNRLVLNAGDSGAGTNLACGNVQLTTGLGTGTGNNPLIDFVGAKQVASGTGAHAVCSIGFLQHFGDGGAASYNHFRLVSPLDANDLFDIATYADGVTVIKTDDNAGAEAHLVLDSDGDTSFKKTGTTLATVESLRTESFLLAASDETTSLVVGVRKVRFRVPYAFTLTDVRLGCNVAPTGAALTVDISDDGTSIFDDGTNNGVRPTIAASAFTSVGGTAHVFATGGGAATPTVAIADDSVIGVDVDVIGSTVAGAGLKVTLIGYKTV